MWIKVIRKGLLSLWIHRLWLLLGNQGQGNGKFMLILHENIYLQNHRNPHADCMVICFHRMSMHPPLFPCSSREEKICLPCTIEPSAKWPHLPSHLRFPRGPYIGVTWQDHPQSSMGTSLEYLSRWLSMIPLPELTDFWKNGKIVPFSFLKSIICNACLSKSIAKYRRTDNTQISERILGFLSLLDPN